MGNKQLFGYINYIFYLTGYAKKSKFYTDLVYIFAVFSLFKDSATPWNHAVIFDLLIKALHIWHVNRLTGSLLALQQANLILTSYQTFAQCFITVIISRTLYLFWIS